MCWCHRNVLEYNSATPQNLRDPSIPPHPSAFPPKPPLPSHPSAPPPKLPRVATCQVTYPHLMSQLMPPFTIRPRNSAGMDFRETAGRCSQRGRQRGSIFSPNIFSKARRPQGREHIFSRVEARGPEGRVVRVMRAARFPVAVWQERGE